MICNLLEKKQPWLTALTVHSPKPPVIICRILWCRKAESHSLAYSLKIVSWWIFPELASNVLVHCHSEVSIFHWADAPMHGKWCIQHPFHARPVSWENPIKCLASLKHPFLALPHRKWESRGLRIIVKSWCQSFCDFHLGLWCSNFARSGRVSLNVLGEKNTKYGCCLMARPKYWENTA